MAAQPQKTAGELLVRASSVPPTGEPDGGGADDRRVRFKRVTLNFPADLEPDLKKLKENTFASSLSEAIRRAMADHLYIHQLKEEGWKLVLRKGSEEIPAPGTLR